MADEQKRLSISERRKLFEGNQQQQQKTTPPAPRSTSTSTSTTPKAPSPAKAPTSSNTTPPAKLSRSSSLHVDNVDVAELRRQIEEVKSRLAIYEEENPDKKALNVEEEKKRVQKVFEMFDTDKSGTIDAFEFQELAYQLGIMLSLEEVHDYIKTIDTDGNGTVDFNEFYAWWTTKEDENTSLKDKTGKMRVLKMKLQSKAYIRALTNLSQKYKEGLKGSLSNSANNVINKNSEQGVEDNNMTSIRLDVEAGKVREVKSSLSLQYRYDDQHAKEVREKLKIKEERAIVVTFSFEVKEGIEDFALGELSGNIKSALYIAKDIIKFTEFKTSLLTENNKKIYRVAIYYTDENILEAVEGIVGSIGVKTFALSLNFDSVPSSTDDRIPHLHLVLNAEAPRNTFDTVKEMTGKFMPNNPSLEQLLKVLIHAKVVLQFTDLNDFVGKFTTAEAVQFQGWGSLSEWARPVLKEVLNDKELPAPAKSTYYNITEMISGLENISLQVGSHSVELKTNNMNLIELLPKKDQLEDE